MIDTIILYFFIVISEEDLEYWIPYAKPDGKDGRIVYYQIVRKLSNGGEFIYTYFPYADKKGPYIKLEFSLPHVLFGNNFEMIYNFKGAIDKANTLLPVVPGVPELDVWKGILRRIDICYNHFVGPDNVAYYLKAYQSFQYSRRSTISYLQKEVLFKNNSISGKLYNKKKAYESQKNKYLAQSATGTLRQEVTCRYRKIKQLTKMTFATLENVDLDFLIGILEEELRVLNILENPIYPANTAYNQFLQKYRKKGMDHYGKWQAINNSSVEDVAHATNRSVQTVKRWLKKFKDDGIVCLETDSVEPLKPLMIDQEMIHTKAKEQKFE